MDKAFNKACDKIGAANLARRLGVSPQAINGWKKGTRPIPVYRCVQIEQIPECEVTRKQLRPDDWQKIWPELATPSLDSHEHQNRAHDTPEQIRELAPVEMRLTSPTKVLT
jgi:DNA-binding transcriptional regulator YdaS (Cro superfamily)